MESRLIGKIVRRRFRVEDVIGRGGMAVVYRAFDLRTHQTIALKVLREEYENDPEYKERFRREAEVCRRLNHPNVVNLVDAGTVGGISFIALEYVDGQTLKDIIVRQGKLSQDDAVHFTLQTLAALAHAHQKGVVHRDIKPQNLLITRNGQLKVSDFGIAGIADTKTLTSDGSVIGSVHYFSPEQAKGMRATSASDLYSVGVILYEMLTGHVPFDGESAVSVAMMHLMQEPESLEGREDVSPAVAMIVAKSLRKPVQERYQSADAMTRDLRRALRHPDGLFMKNERPKVRQKIEDDLDKRYPQWTRIAYILAIVALALMVTVTGIGLYRRIFITTRVPDLSGMDRLAAERALQNAHLSATFIQETSAEIPAGVVLRTEPTAQEELARGEDITVVLSAGTGMLTVPWLSGMTEEEARTSLLAQGFAVGEVNYQINERAAGTVAAQIPEGGSAAEEGTTVNLTLSLGRVIMPDLVGMREEEARQRVTEVGLSVGNVSSRSIDTPASDGLVTEQDPEKLLEVAPGETVNLVVGRYDLRRYTASILISGVDIGEGGSTVRVTLIEDDGTETEMYAAEAPEGPLSLNVTLRSEFPGPKAWRLYIDGNFKEEQTAVLQ